MFQVASGYLKVRALNFFPSAADEFGPQTHRLVRRTPGRFSGLSLKIREGSAMRFHEFGEVFFCWGGGGYLPCYSNFTIYYTITVQTNYIQVSQYKQVKLCYFPMKPTEPSCEYGMHLPPPAAVPNHPSVRRSLI